MKIDGEFEEYTKGLDNTQSFSDALDVETYHFNNDKYNIIIRPHDEEVTVCIRTLSGDRWSNIWFNYYGGVVTSF